MLVSGRAPWQLTEKERCVCATEGERPHTEYNEKNDGEGKRNKDVLGHTMRDFFFFPPSSVGVACELPSDRHGNKLAPAEPIDATWLALAGVGSATRIFFCWGF